jgi:hypothetical protein
MAFSLQNLKLPSTGASNSWTDFYVNVTNKQLERTFQIKKNAQKAIGKKVGLGFIINAADAWWFANVITDEYDKIIKNGKTLIGGVPIESGNKKLMALILTNLLMSTQKNKKGNLLRDIGPAVQAYWTGATLKKFPSPNIPCIGSLKNINTITALNLSPGVWTPISVGPSGSNGPFLLNFILSASVHLLTVGGFFSCNCQYPPPAPPAPGMLPWVGYFVNPFSGNPLSSFDFKSLVKSLGKGLAWGAGAAATLAALVAVANLLNAGDKKKKSKRQISKQLDLIFAGQTPQPEIRAALQAIMEGDSEAMAQAAEALNKLEAESSSNVTNEVSANNTNTQTTSTNVRNNVSTSNVTNQTVINTTIPATAGIGIPLLQQTINTAITLAENRKKINNSTSQTGSIE